MIWQLAYSLICVLLARFCLRSFRSAGDLSKSTNAKNQQLDSNSSTGTKRTMSQSWFDQSELSWIESFLFRILRCGTIPNHIAVIMDGNRRYAKREQLNKRIGYSAGFDTITKVSQPIMLPVEQCFIFAC